MGTGGKPTSPATGAIELPLVGAGGEPVDLRRTLGSHGVADLPPMCVDEAASSLRTTLSMPGRGPRTVRVEPGRPGFARIVIEGAPATLLETEAITSAVRHILRLDADLSGFYALAGRDPALAWVVGGAGRMTRCQTVFEEVVKTVCTTNCAWSATVRMVSALVRELGGPAPDAPAEGWEGRAFPTAAAMAAADDVVYREAARCGYRGAYLRRLAESVASGENDLEQLGTASSVDLPDDELERRLLALPGVGPYAAAHVMTMLGRYSRLVLDSWTRPTYARVTGREVVPDKEINAAFASYGEFAGLAFWLTVTRAWHIPDDPGSGTPA